MYYRVNQNGFIIDWSDTNKPYTDDCLYTEKQIIVAWDGIPYIEGNEPEMPEDIAKNRALINAKAARASEVNRLKVTVKDMVFDADETNIWVLADNSVVMVTKADLLEAGKLARMAQSAIWVAPYIN